MTGRERLTNICNRLPIDRIAWTTLVDDITRSVMPKEIREMPVFDFYRYIGCDILSFGNYGLPENCRVIPPCRLIKPEIEIEEYTNSEGTLVRKEKTTWGTLTSTFKKGHPVKHPVETIEEARILKNIWLNSHYELVEGTEESWNFVNKAIGEDGIYVATLDQSVIQQLLEYDMGLINFYYLLQDYQAEMEELFDIMHKCRLKEYEIFASKSPADVIMSVENTSSTMISPAMYEKYSLPQLSDFVSIMHKYNKKAILHMCGYLKNLLPVIKETGLDGVNALTPPPVGDTPLEYALDVLGEDIIILGGGINSIVFLTKSAEEIRKNLEERITPRIRNSHFLLSVPGDGRPVSLDRYMVVRDWIEENGKL